VTEARHPADYFCSIQVSANPEGASGGPTAGAGDPQVAEVLKLIAEQNRELIQLSRRQLEVSQRMEERYLQQIHAQREEFVRWIGEIPGLSSRGKKATEAIRDLLGRLIDDLVDYVEENKHHLDDSDYVRNDMVDRYGQLLNHISAIYGMLKRLSTADEG
jgi:HPt (histidine-containing phosphotransfer) domain-containing protein